jgi:SAM-dependent methyltransferase
MNTHHLRARSKRVIRKQLRRVGFELTRLEAPRFMATPGAAVDRARREHDPRLAALRARYATVDSGAVRHSFWSTDRVDSWVDLEHFRGHGMYVWQYLERPVVTEQRYFLYLSYLERQDHAGLLAQVEEDGAFGAPVFDFPSRNPVSRDLLDSVNEILYLDRQLGILARDDLRVLDIGAGYGRLAHRMAQLVPGLVDYACADAIPESTYVCERYLAHRLVQPPCRVIELPDASREISAGRFDLAVNVHSFSEMSIASVEHWIGAISDGKVLDLMVVPNAPTALESLEADGSKRDLMPLFRDAGYELDHREPIITDPATRALFGIEDHFHLFRLT